MRCHFRRSIPTTLKPGVDTAIFVYVTFSFAFIVERAGSKERRYPSPSFSGPGESLQHSSVLETLFLRVLFFYGFLCNSEGFNV